MQVTVLQGSSFAAFAMVLVRQRDRAGRAGVQRIADLNGLIHACPAFRRYPGYREPRSMPQPMGSPDTVSTRTLSISLPRNYESGPSSDRSSAISRRIASGNTWSGFA